MLGFRFSYMYKLHAESFMGFNAVCLPGNTPGAFYRSSLPATPVSTPIRENGRFSAQALRERLCRTPSPRKYRLFEPRASEPEIGFNLYDVGLQLSSPDDEIDEEAPFPNSSMQGLEQQCERLELQETRISGSVMKRRVFVGNLGNHMKKDKLQNFFSKFGRVLDCIIAQDHIMRQSRGYGFVLFANQEDAQKAQMASNVELEFAGRVLRVLPCQPKRSANYRREARELLLNWNLENYNSEGNGNFSSNEVAYSPHECVNYVHEAGQLNNDALLLIFSYLNYLDRLKLELVCKQWQALSHHLWRSTRVLQLRDTFYNEQRLTNDILCSLLKKCGRYLLKLDFSDSTNCVDSKCGELIAILCPNLESLDLAGISMSNAALRFLATNCKKLTHVSLRCTENISEKGVWWLLHLCKNIESLDVGRNPSLTGRCLHMAAPRIEKLNVENCTRFSQDGFFKIATKCQNLVYLNISNCFMLTDHALELLCQSLHKLKELCLAGHFHLLSTRGLDQIGRLSNLEALSLRDNECVKDETIQAIVIGCRNLGSLNISETCITDKAFSYLGSCYSLKKLQMNYLKQLTDESLCLLSRHSGLEFLEMRGCFQMGDQGLVSILTVSSRLQHLDLSGLERVTNVIIRSCYDAVNIRHNDKPLHLIMGGTNTVHEALDFRPHPLLSISTINYCKYTTDDYHSGDFIREYEAEEGAVGGEIYHPREEKEDAMSLNFSWDEVSEYPL